MQGENNGAIICIKDDGEVSGVHAMPMRLLINMKGLVWFLFQSLDLN